MVELGLGENACEKAGYDTLVMCVYVRVCVF